MMSEPKLSYIGPLAKHGGASAPAGFLRKIPLAFILVVVVPTLLTAIYFLVIASPRYVSEAKFVVRTPAKQQSLGLGAALQNVGLSAAPSDSFAIHEYVTSPDGMRELMQRVDVRKAYALPGVDVLSRLPRPFSDDSQDSFRKAFVKSYLTVGHSSQNGISTLRVEAFTARDAQRINAALLEGGEQLVNRLNERAAADGVTDARRTVAEAQTRLAAAQTALADFRNREQFIDPARSALAGTQLMSEMAVNLANLRAERAQVAADAPNSPQLPFLDSRIRAFEQQVQIEQNKIVGNSDSLATKISAYEDLALEREFADKILTSAVTALESAEQEAKQKRLYLDLVVSPTLPDRADEPRRWYAIFSVLLSALVIYGIGWLVMAGIRESQVRE